MPVAPPLGFVGLGKETVKGTGVAPTAFAPVRKNRGWQDMLAQLDDDGMRGVMADGPYDQIPGVLYGTYECGGPSFPDTEPWFAMGALGDVATLAFRTVADGVTNATTLVTSATAAFTQADVGRPLTGSVATADFPANTWIVAVLSATNITISTAALSSGATKVLNIGVLTSTQWHHGAIKNSTDGQAGSITLTDFYGLGGGTPARQFPGMQVDEYGVKWTGDGLREYAAKLVGFASTNVAKPTNTLSTVTAHPGWEMQANIGGNASLIVVSGEFNMKRGAQAIHTADGTQAPYKIWQSGLNVSGKLTMVAEDDVEYLRYLNHTTPVVLLHWQHGAGAATVASQINMSKCNLSVGKAKHDGDYMTWEMEYQALWNATDAGASGGASPCRVGFQNLLAAATYQ